MWRERKSEYHERKEREEREHEGRRILGREGRMAGVGTRLGLAAEHAILDLNVMSSCPTLGVELT